MQIFLSLGIEPIEFQMISQVSPRIYFCLQFYAILNVDPEANTHTLDEP